MRTSDRDRDLRNRRKEKSRKSAELTSGAKSFLSPSGYRSKCFVRPKMVPVNFSSTVSIKMGTTSKRFTEEITFQSRYIPVYYSAKMENVERFAASLEIECSPKEKTVIKQPFIYQDLILPPDKRSPVLI